MMEITWLMVALIIGTVFTTTVLFNMFIVKITNTMKFLRFQLLLNPLKQNDDNDIKIELLTGKVDAGLLDCVIDSNFLVFKEKPTDGEPAKTVARIWIGVRYVAYGILTNYGQEMEITTPYKPSFESLKKIIELEKILKGEQLSSQLNSEKEVQLD